MRKDKTKIHWGGETSIINKRGALIKTLSGFPCCCSGYRAELVKARGDLTTDPEKVTCTNCIKRLERTRGEER